MTITPPPPADLAGLVEAYAVTTAAVLDLADSVTAEQADAPTECPGWTVADQVRHVLTTEQMMQGAPVPDVDVSAHAHVRHEFGAVIEKYLESARGMSVGQVVEELRRVHAERLEALSAPGVTLDTEVPGPFGPTALSTSLGIRVFDIWCHEQDLREALDRPGGLDTPAARVAVARMLAGLPRAIATGAEIPEGTIVELVVRGEVSGRLALRMATDERGRARGIPLEDGDRPTEATRIVLTTREFARRAAGRWPVEQLSPEVTGDEGVAARVLLALPVTP